MLIGYVGEEDGMRCGKTLLMTARLHRFKLRRGTRTLTNYGATFQDGPLTPEMLETHDEELEEVQLGIDEIHNWIDSRASPKQSNRRISYFITQTAKRHVRAHYTTQVWKQVDVRIRQNTDYLVLCKKVAPHTFRYKVIKTPYFRPRLVRAFLMDGRRIYPLYNTKQKIREYRGLKPNE